MTLKNRLLIFSLNLYTSKQGVYEPYQVCGNFLSIDEYRLTNLDAEIKEKKIRQVVFNMSPLKAL